MRPVFGTAQIYDDTIPALNALRSAGYRTGIVSNTPWGSPGYLWREELARWGLDTAVDDAVFCTDVGIRKPSREIFEYALKRLGAAPQQCVFIGDNPRCDVEGSEGVGMQALLIDREGENSERQPELKNLGDLLNRLEISIK